LCSFEGCIIKYDYNSKSVKTDKHVKHYVEKEQIDKYITNPPFLNKCICDEKGVYIGLMNGVLLSMKNNLKKKNLKSIHNSSIVEIKNCNFDGEYIISLGKDKCLKIFDKDTFKIRYTLDVEADSFTCETDLNGNIYYIDLKNELKIISLKM
jgi:hypothetical protein